VTLDTYSRCHPSGTPLLKLVDFTNKMKMLLLLLVLIKLIADSYSHLLFFCLLIFM